MVGTISLVVAMELTECKAFAIRQNIPNTKYGLRKCLLTVPNTDAPKIVIVAFVRPSAKIPYGDEKGDSDRHGAGDKTGGRMEEI
jgi:hypothetical protein